MSKSRKKLQKGLEYLAQGKFKAALKYLELAVRAKGSNLEHDAAAWWMVNVAKYRREWKKRKYGNANLYYYEDAHTGKAWSDLEIAAVLLAPNTKVMNKYLVRFLGRSPESIRFQYRYAHGRALSSWLSESGERYTRYTQTMKVKNRLGV